MKVDEMKGNSNEFEINGIIVPNVSIWHFKTTFSFLFSFFSPLRIFISVDGCVIYDEEFKRM